jgi:hypothetical protein
MCCSLVSVEQFAHQRPDAVLAIRDGTQLGLKASSTLLQKRLNVPFGMAILGPQTTREHFARLSVCLDPPSDDLQIGALRQRASFDESSVDANDHLLRQLIGFSVFGDLLSDFFVDALSNRDQPGSVTS